MISFILADIRRFAGGAIAVALLIALSVGLCVTVTLQERALRLGSARAAEKFDLVVGAAGSETQLTLSTVFLQAAPLPLMPGEVLARLSADPRVSLAAPVGFGDSFEGYPIAGTTTALISSLSPELAEGKMFARLGEAVIGSDVDLTLGNEIKPLHGTLESGGHTHTEGTYTVTGRMAPTGTAWDRAILVPIRAVWQIHGMEAGEGHDQDHEAGHEAGHEDHAHGTEEAAATEHGHDHEAAADAHDHDHASHGAAPATLLAQPETSEEEKPEPAATDMGHDDHDHHGHVDPDAPLDEVFTADTPGLPAVLVKPKSFADAYKLRQEYRRGDTLAVFPGEVLTRLYGTLGDARSILLALAIGTQAIVIAAILMVTIMHVGARRRQIGALRALGIPRRSVLQIVWGELFGLFIAGAALGTGVGYGAALLLSEGLAAATAVHMPVEFASEDIPLVLGFLAVAAIVSIVPACAALRISPAQALRA
ncbi:acidobacterial duplicated orphan permease [Pannonibacter phragmitetus]|uniref:Acidobacterial duplicated orphan permease n=1 Tax=Pannonibacter phragmitetus TaxID=121719 RepID=A0A378ZY43_9HYPH|nr:ABC transporter permease [Pannonibacter phragmitetus]SUB01461.1 acidobacterial duplicated orphan permease [Pannonibacter phragmitetus]